MSGIEVVDVIASGRVLAQVDLLDLARDVLRMQALRTCVAQDLDDVARLEEPQHGRDMALRNATVSHPILISDYPSYSVACTHIVCALEDREERVVHRRRELPARGDDEVRRLHDSRVYRQLLRRFLLRGRRGRGRGGDVDGQLVVVGRGERGVVERLAAVDGLDVRERVADGVVQGAECGERAHGALGLLGGVSSGIWL